MARPPQYRSVNIHTSIIRRIGQTRTVNAVIYPVLHERAWRDPEERRRPATTPDVAWIETHWTSRKAGLGTFSVLQVDVYSRKGNPADVLRDELGILSEQLADDICEEFLGVDPAFPGGKRWCVQVLDIEGGAPFADTGGRAMCQASSGRFGVPDSRSPAGLRNEMWRITMSFNFRMPRDTGHNAAFYTE